MEPTPLAGPEWIGTPRWQHKVGLDQNLIPPRPCLRVSLNPSTSSGWWFCWSYPPCYLTMVDEVESLPSRGSCSFLNWHYQWTRIWEGWVGCAIEVMPCDHALCRQIWHPQQGCLLQNKMMLWEFNRKDNALNKREKLKYPFLQHSCKSALRSGQAMQLQADAVEEVSACFPHGSMIPSFHWLHEVQIALFGDMHL